MLSFDGSERPSLFYPTSALRSLCPKRQTWGGELHLALPGNKPGVSPL